MTFESARYVNPDYINAKRVDDESIYGFPAVEGNRAFDELVKSGITIEPFVAPGEYIAPISRRQFFAGLEKRGKITKAEALAAMKSGVLPAALQTIVDGITDANQRYEIDMLLSGATEFRRDNAFVPIFAAAINWNNKHTDDFWKFAATL